MKGKIITLEGIDGSGKGTQSQLLIDAFKALGVPVKMYSFPAYDSTFYGGECGAFLRGDYGSFEQVHPKLASILFANDRREQKPAMLKDLEDGVFIVCDRFVESNAAHQSAKLPQEERQPFLDWITQMEYGVHGLPKPDITLFLNLPIEYSKALVLKKKQRSYTDEKEDIHEAQHGYLEQVYHQYKHLQQTEGWTTVECVDDNGLRTIEAIHVDIVTKVRAFSGI